MAMGYILCTSPRSGSTLMCRMLSQTGIAGAPGSHFHVPSLSNWQRTYGVVDMADIVSSAIKLGRGETDLFGLRLQHQSAAFFFEQMRKHSRTNSTDVTALQTVFGDLRFIYLTRENKLDQAISFLKAQQTGLWHKAPDGTEIERLAPPAPPSYDAEAISALVTRFEAADIWWKNWFETQGISPLRLTYRDLEQTPRKTLGTVLNALGLPSQTATSIEIPVAKLADKTSTAWAKRYLAEKGYQTPLP